MYIVAVGWLYVALMMAITEANVVAGVATFLGYGVAPVALVLYILGTPERRRRRKAAEARADAAAASRDTKEAGGPSRQQSGGRPPDRGGPPVA